VTITGVIDTGSGVGNHPSVWVDRCVLQGISNAYGNAVISQAFYASYITDSSVYDNASGAQNYNLVRNVNCDRIGGDAFTMSLAVINSSVSGLGQQPDSPPDFPDFHTDVWQFNGVANNIILYGITATERIGLTQAFQFDYVQSDVAIVDVLIAPWQNWALSHTYTNIYVKDSTINVLLDDTNSADQAWSPVGLHATDIFFDNVTFTTTPSAHSGVTYR